jgi:hypothetical protein
MSSNLEELAASIQHGNGAMSARVKPEGGLGRHGLPPNAEPAMMHDAFSLMEG